MKALRLCRELDEKREKKYVENVKVYCKECMNLKIRENYHVCRSEEIVDDWYSPQHSYTRETMAGLKNIKNDCNEFKSKW